jgi:uncharacterized protein YndB with AHSA1/START domain
MAINEHAPVVARGETHIAAPPDVVWQVMSTVSDWPSWNPDIKEARLEGPLAPGSRFRWRAGPGQITSVLRDVRPGQLLEWTGSTFGVKAVHVWRLEPADAGTIARTEESWEGLLATLFRGRSKRTLDAAIESGLRLLKAESERRAAEASRP